MPLPSNDKVPGYLGHTDDHNAIVDEIAQRLPISTASTLYLGINNTARHAQTASSMNVSQLTGNTLPATIVSSSLTGLGTLGSLTVSGNLTVDTNTLFVNSANNYVGIGTTSPAVTLHVNGVAGTDPTAELRISSSVGWMELHGNLSQGSFNALVQPGDRGIVFSNTGGSDTGNFSIVPWANFPMGIRISTTSSGVTIGQNLTVTGLSQFPDGSASNPSITNTGDTNTGMFFPEEDTLGFSKGGVEVMRIGSAGQIIIPGGTSASPALTRVSGTTTGIFFPDGAQMAFSTSGIERWRIDSGGTLRSTNNTSFQPQIQIKNTNTDTSAGYFIFQKMPTDNTLITGDILGNLIWQGSATDGVEKTSALIVAAADGPNTASNVPSSIRFSTSAGGTSAPERMRITSTGNVGIGTTTPAHHLEVSSGTAFEPRIGIRNTNTDNSPGYLIFEKDPSDNSITINDTIGSIRWRATNTGNSQIDSAEIRVSADASNDATSTAGRILFLTTASGGTITERMRITSTGNVGIGTSSPLTTLNVLGQTWLNNSSGDSVARALGLTISTAPGANFNPGSDPGDALRNTGIVVKGSTRPSILTFRNIDNSLSFWDFIADGNTNKFFIQRPSANPVVTFDSNDRVGIGTTTPSAKLHLSGTLLLGDSFKRSVGDGFQTVMNQDIYLEQVGNSGLTALTAVLNRNDGNGPRFYLAKTRGTSAGAVDSVQNGDEVGTVAFAASDGNTLNYRAAQLSVSVDANVSASIIPGRFTIWTTSSSGTLTERMRINRDGLITGTGQSLGPWQTYVPTLSGSGWSIGDGTATGAYCQIGKIVLWRAQITFGSTSTFGSSSAPTVTVPVNMRSGVSGNFMSDGKMVDISLDTQYNLDYEVVNATTVGLIFNSTNGRRDIITATSPFTFASSDYLLISGMYEAA